MTTELVGKCQECGGDLYYDDINPVSDNSNVGDYDIICYPCQFDLIDSGLWDDWKERNL